MTNDYKDLLLKYLTGNIIVESPLTTPYYENIKYSRGSAEDWQPLGQKTIRCKDGNGKYNGKTLCWSSPNNKVLTLVDENGDVIKRYTKYNTGTNLGSFLDLNVDEDGRFYGIDFDSTSGKYRFLLLNNLSEPTKTINGLEYQCVLRNSYYLQGYDGMTIYYSWGAFLTKSKNSALYYFSILTNGDTPGTYKLVPSTLQINVGESNEWTRLTDIPFTTLPVTIDNYTYFNNNDVPNSFYYVIYNKVINGNSDRTVMQINAVGEGEPITTTLWNSMNSLYDNATNSNNYQVRIKAIEEDKYYLFLYGRKPDNTQYKQLIKVYKISTNSLVMLLSQEGEISIDNAQYNYPVINYDVIGNTVYFLYQFQALNDVDSKNKLWFSLLNANNRIDYKINTNRLVPPSTSQPIIVNEIFDLKKIYYAFEDDDEIETDIISLVFNELYYCGEEYETGISLVPKEGLLYNSDDELIYARLLYNTKVYKNRTTSTINVPFNILNNDTISKENILGWTNVNLIENDTTIQKNIYEDLYINYFNTLKMQDQNTSNYKDNLLGAIRLNKSSSYSQVDYELGRATKFRINYSDNTSKTSGISSTISDGICTYEMYVYQPSDKTINNIEIISDDENTVYLTIDSFPITMETNKLYKIQQDVHVE